MHFHQNDSLLGKLLQNKDALISVSLFFEYILICKVWNFFLQGILSLIWVIEGIIRHVKGTRYRLKFYFLLLPVACFIISRIIRVLNYKLNKIGGIVLIVL